MHARLPGFPFSTWARNQAGPYPQKAPSSVKAGRGPLSHIPKSFPGTQSKWQHSSVRFQKFRPHLTAYPPPPPESRRVPPSTKTPQTHGAFPGSLGPLTRPARPPPLLYSQSPTLSNKALAPFTAEDTKILGSSGPGLRSCTLRRRTQTGFQILDRETLPRRTLIWRAEQRQAGANLDP